MLAALVCATAAAAVGAPAGTAVLFHLDDPRIGEASGIAVGLASPGVVYVHNDSGDQARFFAVDGRTGMTRATYTVPGATNVDWEDIAVAPDARGVPSVWLADVGDNSATRTEIALYRVDEPRVDTSAYDVAATTTAPETWRLRYPGAAADAEALAVSPGGAAYLFTKSLTGITNVFALPEHANAARVQVLRAIGSVRLAFTGTPGGPNPFGQRTVTGAALSRDGTTLALRTYTDAYVWPVTRSGLAAAITARPLRIALPAQPQGEGIGFDGGRVLIDSEGTGSAVYSLAVPRFPTRATGNSPATARSAAPPLASPDQSTAVPPRIHSAWVGLGAGLLIIAMVYLMIRLTRPERQQARRDRRRDRDRRPR